MQQSVHAADVDEGAVIGEVANRAGDDVTFLELCVALLFDGALFFLHHHAAVDDQVFVGYIEFSDPAAYLLPDQLFHFCGIANAAARGRHEGADADIDAEAAFDLGADGADDGRLLGERALQCGPVLRPRDFEARELVVTFRIAAFHRDWKSVADLHGLACGLKAGEWENAFSLVADVEQHGIFGDGDDRALQLPDAVFDYASMTAFVLREKVAKRLVGFVVSGVFRKIVVRHERVTAS